MTSRTLKRDYPRGRAGKRARTCGRCETRLDGENYRAFAVYEEPELGCGLKLCYRFCPRCWGIIREVLESEGVESV